MPTSKPLGRAQRALGVFIISLYLIIGLMLYRAGPHPSWIYIGFIIVLLLLAIPLSLRFFYNYKIIEAAKGVLIVRKPYLGLKRKFNLKEVQEVNEEKIKTMNTEYKLLSVYFPSYRVEISNQEYSNYSAFRDYVFKFKPKKKKK